MKIVVLNGSPKGQVSVTMQYVKYAANAYPEHTFTTLDISWQQPRIEREPGSFAGILSEIRGADAVLIASPVYCLAVPAQFQRFFEYVLEQKAKAAFCDKPLACLTTSIHFMDDTAVRFLKDVAGELGADYLGHYSADMHDLLQDKERTRFRKFLTHFFDDAQAKPSPTSAFPSNKRVVILTEGPEESDLNRLVTRFRNSISAPDLETINIDDVKLAGSCRGCIQCGLENVCVYHGKDGYRDFIREVRAAEILVIAAKIHLHTLRSPWKALLERAYVYTHKPCLEGKQIGFILSGSLRENPNLELMIRNYMEYQKAHLVDIVTDETNTPEIASRLQRLARNLTRYAAHDYHAPLTFPSVGGWKIMRDNMYGRLRLAYQDDHKYYRENGYYDFPKYTWRLPKFLFLIVLRIPRVKRWFLHNLRNAMVRHFRKPVEAAHAERLHSGISTRSLP